MALALVAVACGKSSSKTGGTASGGGNADHLIIGTTDSLQNSFDPAEVYDYFGQEVVANTAETLVTYGPNAAQPTPLLAAEMPTVSADGMTYTFKLRTGVKFQDGTTMDSAAVKFSLLRARDFGAKDSEAAGFLLSGIKDIATPDASTVVITLDKPNVTFVSRLSYQVASIISPTAYASNVLAGSEAATDVLKKYKTDTIVGTGQYKLTSYKEKESLQFDAFDGYWGTPAKTKQILVKLYDKSSALKLALQNKEVDIAFRSLQPDENSFFKGRSGFQLVEGSAPGIRYITFNVKSAPFNNINLRKAVAAAVDRKAVVDEVLKGGGKPLESMVPTSFPTYDAKWSDLYGSAPDKNKVNDYLTKANIPAGQKVNIDFWYSPTHYGDTEAAFAQLVKRSLEDTGRFTVNVQNVEWAEYGTKRKAGELPVFLMGWYPDYLDEDDYLEPFADPNVFDPAKWDDPAMLALVHKEQITPAGPERTKIIKDAQAYMAEQVPYVPMYQINQFAAAQSNVKGIVLDPIQIFRYWLISKSK
jgi:peptide/nickel transport system substrate-binding protein